MGAAHEGPLPYPHLGRALQSAVVTLPMVSLWLKGASVSFYTYLLLWHFPGKRRWAAELS